MKNKLTLLQKIIVISGASILFMIIGLIWAVINADHKTFSGILVIPCYLAMGHVIFEADKLISPEDYE